MPNKNFHIRCIFITESFITAYNLLDDPRSVKMILYKVYFFFFFINCSVSSCALLMEQCGLIDSICSRSQLVCLVTLGTCLVFMKNQTPPYLPPPPTRHTPPKKNHKKNTISSAIGNKGRIPRSQNGPRSCSNTPKFSKTKH